MVEKQLRQKVEEAKRDGRATIVVSIYQLERLLNLVPNRETMGGGANLRMTGDKKEDGK